MIDFITTNNIRFHYRAAGVAIQNGHVLLHQTNDEAYWILPGGRVEAGETSSQALRREMREELGQDVEVGRFQRIRSIFSISGPLRPHDEEGRHRSPALALCPSSLI